MKGSRSAKQLSRQDGFLAITLVIIIVIVGFVMAAIAYTFSQSGRSVGHTVQSAQAFGLAEGALDQGFLAFNTTPGYSQYPCPTTVTSSNPSCAIPSWTTAQSFGNGQFEYLILNYAGPAWSSSYSPSAPTTTTSKKISPSSSSQVVPVASIANFAPNGGQIIVGSTPLYLNYTGVSTSTSTCGSSYSACFTGVLYDGTSSISSGTTVKQNQTVLTVALNSSWSLQTVSIANTSNLAPCGGVTVGNQLLYYLGVSNDPSICGTTPCLTDVWYPPPGSTLPVNTRVSQSQIFVEGQGAVPNFSSPQGQRVQGGSWGAPGCWMEMDN